MQRFGRISEIDPAAPASWRGRVFLTLDIDWAHDEVLAECVDLVEAAGVPATWFVTHDTPMLARLSANPRFELGLHPNFNPLLAGDASGGGAADVLQRLQALVPEAKSVRSHSLAQSTGLARLFREAGLTHECNQFVAAQAGIALKPWALWTVLVKVPHFWEDDLACKMLKTAYEQLLEVDPAKPGPSIGPYPQYDEAVRKSLESMAFDRTSPDKAIATAQKTIQGALDQYIEDNKR